MRIVEATFVGGTGAINRDHEWTEPDSPFSKYMLARGVINSAFCRPGFVWTTNLNFGATAHNDWVAGGAALSYYEAAHEAMRRKHIEVPNDPAEHQQTLDHIFAGAGLAHHVIEEQRTPGKDTFIIAHSWGGAVALYAAAEFDLKIECLVTVGTPVVKQMEPVAEKARPNIKRWLHLYSKRDWIQVLGGLLDGRLGIYRKQPFADRNDEMPKGHSDVLRDPELFPLWIEKGWISYLTEGK